MNNKHNKSNWHKSGGLFFWIGLNISLLLVITAFEWESTYDTAIMNPLKIEDVFEEEIKITKQEELKPPKPKVIAPKLVEVEDDPLEEQPELVIDIEDLTIDEMEEIIEDNAMEDEPIETVWGGLVETKPEPISGYKAFYTFIAKNMKYPSQARRMGIEGKVFIQFMIDEFGNITNPEVVRGIGSGCDEEALRVVKLLPPWKPGKQRGRPVRVMMVLPITFKLGG